VRIASLVPSSTEMLFALGLGDSVVAVTHECDFPAAAGAKPHLTRTVIPEGLSAREIDAEVKRVTAEGRALYELDEAALAQLDVDLIVTQAVCEVCAVSYDDVVAAAARLPSRPRVLSLDPSTLGEVLADVGRLAEAAGVVEAGHALRGKLDERLAAVREAVGSNRSAAKENGSRVPVPGCTPRPTILALEWLDPPFLGGHWVPEMIAIAGGTALLSVPGEKSREADWDELRDLAPDVAVVMPCGYYVAESRRQAQARAEELASLGAAAIWVVDAASSFSRPGPRLVDGVELLAHLLHPDRVEAPARIGFERFELGVAAG
jgi:iron complex transport system substrate-binding protein